MNKFCHLHQQFLMTMILKLFNKNMKQNDKTRPAEKDVYPPDLKYPPKKPRLDKDDYAVIILFSFLFIGFLGFFYKQIRIQKEAIIIDCKLLSRSFKGSTLEINPVPVVGMGMNGGASVGVGLATSGHGEEYISSFDCGNYGILISDDKEIFRQAKENNKLTVYFGYNDYKILGI